MGDYPFELIDGDTEEQIDGERVLLQRPRSGIGFSFAEDARRFVAGRELDTAINTAIAVGEPLLLTGEPGTGKTQAAYYAAYKLKLEPVIHFQVKSDTTAGDLLYDFDAVRYFHDANIRKDGPGELNKSRYIEPRALWEAIENPDTAADLTAILCLVGSVFALLSRYAVNFWNQGLHQGATLSLDKQENVADIFWYPALVCIAGFVLLFVALILIRTKTEIRARRLHALEIRERMG